MLCKPANNVSKLANRRLLSSSLSPTTRSALKSLDAWSNTPMKPIIMTDTMHQSRLLDLAITLAPFRPYLPSLLVAGASIPWGHHLAFFHQRTPEYTLRLDGTDNEFSPPHPFERRMWAGTSFRWDHKYRLRVGDKADATSTIASTALKGFDKDRPMVFVKQRINIVKEGLVKPAIVEERSHVYLPVDASVKGPGVPKQIKEWPTAFDFEYSYTPTAVTLFRFSALMFNAHHIHLDAKYSQETEGYPERLVHGPLSALMLLETAYKHLPNILPIYFECRAVNPVIVNRRVTLRGKFGEAGKMQLWCQDDDGVVGMVANLEFITTV